MKFIRQEDNVLIVTLPEEIDHHKTSELAEQIDETLLNGTADKIIFDFAKTRFMDSSGIGLLVGRYRKVHSFGGQVLVCNVTGHMAKILQLSGIEKFIGKYEGTI